MSLLGKPIEDVITVLYKSIQAKRDVIEDVKRECKLNERGEKDVVEISKLKLIDLLEEFEITISQSLQCIQTLQAEICNLKENIGDTSTSSTIKEFVGCSCIEAISPQGKDVNNISVITSLTSNNGHNQSQVYHKPKLVMQGGKGSGSGSSCSGNKLNFDYSAFMMNNNVNGDNSSTQQAHCVLNENILPPDITTTTTANNNVSISVSNYNCNSNSNKQQQQQQQQHQQQHQPFTISYTNDSDNNSDEEEPKIERTKVPIRQQLMISTNRSYQFNNSNTNTNSTEQHVPSITSRRDVLMSKVNQIEKETKTKQLITKINTNTSYKTYITNKYGNGSYDNFLTKLTSNQIDINTLENELRIISQLIATDKTLQKKKHTNTTNTSNSRYNTITKSRGNTPRKFSKDHTNSTNPSDTIYIEPVKFENTLRSGSSSSSSNTINDHYRSNSKSKRKQTSIDKTIKHI